MKIYHAGAGNDSHELYHVAGVRRSLISYAHAGEAFRFWVDAQPADADVFLDSGAFSAWSDGKRIDLDQYCDYLKGHADRLAAYAALDVIGDWRASAGNLDVMLRAGLSPVPTFHRGSPLCELDRLARVHRHIAVGGLMSHLGRKVHRQTRADLQPHLDAVFSVLERHWPVRVHVFGVAAHQWVLERYPIYSADSATVKIGASLGTYARFSAGTVRWKYWWEDVPETLDGALGDVAGNGKRSAREARWRESTRSLTALERYTTDLWSAKGVVWDESTRATTSTAS